MITNIRRQLDALISGQAKHLFELLPVLRSKTDCELWSVPSVEGSEQGVSLFNQEITVFPMRDTEERRVVGGPVYGSVQRQRANIHLKMVLSK